MEGRGKEEQEERGGGKGQEKTEEGAGESEGPPCATEMLGEASLMEKGSTFRLPVCLAPWKPGDAAAVSGLLGELAFKCKSVVIAVLIAQSCPALCDPWTAACQAFLSMEFSRLPEWVAIPFSQGSS